MKEHIKFKRLVCTKPKYDGYYVVMKRGFTNYIGNDTLSTYLSWVCVFFMSEIYVDGMSGRWYIR